MNKVFLIVLGLASVTLAACAPSTTETSTAPSAADLQEIAAGSAPSENVVDSQEVSDSEVRVIEVEAGSFYYSPDEIRVKKGETVRIVLNSVDMMHDFVIDELDIQTPIVRSGETNTVEFIADTAGTFEYYCSVGAHRAQGQVGTLIVEE
jgi:plastocyanin